MSTHVTTRHPARDDVTFGGGTVRPTRSRRWSIAGIGAGLAGLGILATTTMVNGVYDQDLAGHPQAIADKIAGQTGAMFAFHSIAVTGALLMVVFGVGLYHRLRAVTASDSAAPLVALAGLLGTAVVVVLGAGLDTEFMMSLTFDDKSVDVYNAAMYNHWIGTIPWVWVLAGLSGLATYAVSRAGGVPRWIGRVGLVLGGLTVVLGISPLEYMACVTGSLMVLVTALGFTVGDKQFRG